MKGKCTVCGKEFENLGAHMFHAHDKKPEPLPEVNIVLDDVSQDKRLSDLIGELRTLLKPYRNSIKISVSESGGKPVEVEMIARIQF